MSVEKVSPWILAGSAAAVYLLLAALFLFAAPDLGSTCDRPIDAAGPDVCKEVAGEDPMGFGERSPSPSVQQASFVRVAPPVESSVFWSGAASASVVLAIGLAVVGRNRWRDLRRTYDADYRRGAGWWTAMLGIPAWALSFGIFQAIQADTIETAAVVVVAGSFPWFFSLAAVVLVHGVHQICTEPEAVGQSDTPTSMVGDLRAALGLGVGVLGATLAARVLWNSADLQLVNAIRTTELARVGGTFSSSPQGPESLLLFSLVVTGLLIVIFAVTSTAIDHCARRVRDDRLEGIDRQVDLESYLKQRDLLDGELGLNQTLATKFQSALSVSAPLLVGVLTQLFPSAS